jgi:hypothetical protein
MAPVSSGFKVVEYGFLVGCIQLEHGTAAAAASGESGAIEIARRVSHQTCVGVASVRPVAKRVKHGESLRLGKLGGKDQGQKHDGQCQPVVSGLQTWPGNPSPGLR